MELVMSLLVMLAGVGVFMYGMKQMSTSMEQNAGSGVNNLFKKISKNRIVDYGIGIGATAIVNSSSAVSIMTVGLANAGIVNVKNGAGMILGAKVGTTLTAFLFALSGVDSGGFSVSILFASMAFVGVIIIYTTTSDSLIKFAYFLAGFGMLFAGLELMEYGIGGQDSILSIQLQKLFQFDIMQNSALLVLLGLLFTAIIQSSTAATGLFLIFLMTGVIDTVDQSFFLIMGANIGTCSDGLMASIGTNANGKRIALFHVLTSTIGAVAFSIILVIFRAPIVGIFESVFPNDPQWSLAVYNLIYNLIYTIVLLILLNPLVNFVTKLVKEKQAKPSKIRYIDERLLATPPIAVKNSLKEVSSMYVMAQENVDLAFEGLVNEDTSQRKKIDEIEEDVDVMTRALASYFIKLSATSISTEHRKLIGGLHNVINDIERISDYALLMAKETKYMKKTEAHFLDATKEELSEIYSKISEMSTLSIATFNTREIAYLEKIYDIHEELSSLILAAKDVHVTRLSENLYSIEASKSVYSILFSLQRIADHMVNVAFSIRSDTGSKSEAFENIRKESKKKIDFV